jgi:hypothetical protein
MASIAALNDYDGSDTAGVTTLLARLTSTRAGLLDNLDAATSEVMARLGTPAGASIAADIANVQAAAGATPEDIAEAVADYDTGNGTIAEGVERLNLLPASNPVALAPAPPSDPDLCLLYLDTEDIAGTALTNLCITIVLRSNLPAETSEGRLVSKAARTMQHDPDNPGRYTLAVETKFSYLAQNSELFASPGKPFAVPADAETLNLKDATA